MRSEFITAINANQAAFGMQLAPDKIERLADYYEFVLEHNAILHLVAPAGAEEIAVRHILESLMLLEFLPEYANFADVGAGAGLPSIPCLVVRDDLRATLIESKEKKTKFLNEAVQSLGLATRVELVNRQFEETEAGDFGFVACRALDKFTNKLPKLRRWAKSRTMLLFGGPNLENALREQKIGFDRRLMPLSEQRFLFILRN
jgi:16S rRNA (guanine527-N7)-methyltransferase